MRITLIASVIAAASISTALAQQAAPATAAKPPAPAASAQPPASPSPAQQWSMDHGHAEDAANAAKASTAAAAAKAAAEAAGAASPGPSNNFAVNGSSVIEPPPPRTAEQRKADAEAQSAWQVRCRPSVVEDREGIRKIEYAESDCDLSRFNTAGQ